MKRRGQTLVVFALTLLLLLLMVTMTLSIGMKAKEKMELQTVADAAAYSNAVATARTFNAISLMNRALMGHMVAMTGVESLISWTGYYRASLEASRDAYDIASLPYVAIVTASCPCAPFNPACAKYCKCGTQALKDISDGKDKLKEEDDKVEGKWEGLDKKAGQEAKALQISAISKEQNDLFDLLTANFQEAKLAGAIAAEANKDSRTELEASTSSNTVNQREAVGGESCGSPGAACSRRDAGNKLHFVYAAMGSRGFSFVTGRGEGAPIQDKINRILPRRDRIDVLTNDGSSYFPAEGSKTHSAQTIDATEVWGDDHGTLTLRFGRGQAPCPPMSIGVGSPEAHVRSNHEGDSSDEHKWNGGGDSDAQSHTMGECTLCPGIWPPHMDYNFNSVAAGDNNYGQPKNYAVVQRDYAKRMESSPDPWNLLFRFRFSPGGEGTEFDNRGIRLVTSDTDISKATALSAGIAYYHRQGHWKEPPNFLNPFWRATLVSAHVDTAGKEDVGTTLDEAAPFAAEAYRALDEEEYKGW